MTIIIIIIITAIITTIITTVFTAINGNKALPTSVCGCLEQNVFCLHGVVLDQIVEDAHRYPARLLDLTHTEREGWRPEGERGREGG